MRRLSSNLVYTVVVVLGLASLVSGQKTPKQVPREVEAIAGTFVGSWTMFGIDGRGQVVRKSAWIDTMKAQNPLRNNDRAYVTTMDEMTFEGRPTPMNIEGKE